jgi:hypothetical protein
MIVCSAVFNNAYVTRIDGYVYNSACDDTGRLETGSDEGRNI